MRYVSKGITIIVILHFAECNIVFQSAIQMILYEAKCDICFIITEVPNPRLLTLTHGLLRFSNLTYCGAQT